MTFDQTDSDSEHAAPSGLHDEVMEAIAGAPDAAHAKRMVTAFEQWQTIREYATKERKRLSEQLAARIAQFTEAMNVGHSTANDQILKLSVVETRWQDLEDARTEKKEVGSALRDQIKASEQKIKDLIAEAKSNQMSLFAAAAAEKDGDAE